MYAKIYKIRKLHQNNDQLIIEDIILKIFI